MDDKTNKNIDDLVAFLDGSVGQGVGHINVDTDEKIEEAVNVETMGCTDCSRTPLACSVPTLHQGLDDYAQINGLKVIALMLATRSQSFRAWKGI